MNEDFDDNLKNLFSDFQQKPNNDVWEKLSAKIPPKKKRRGFFWLFFPALILAGTFTYFVFTKNTVKENKNFTAISKTEKTTTQTKPETEQNTAIKLPKNETKTTTNSNSKADPKPKNVSKFSNQIINQKPIQKKTDDLKTSSNTDSFENQIADFDTQNSNISNNINATNNLTENTEVVTPAEVQTNIAENQSAEPITESDNTENNQPTSESELVETENCQWFAPKCWKIKPELNEKGKKLTFAISIGANTNHLSTKEKRQYIEMKPEIVLGYTANLHLQFLSRFKFSAGIGAQNYFEKGNAVISTTGFYDNKFNYQLNTVYKNPILLTSEMANKLGLPFDTLSGRTPNLPSALTEGTRKDNWDTAVVVNFENQIKTLVLPFSLVYEIRIGRIGIPIGGNLAFNIIQQQRNKFSNNNDSFELNQQFNKKLFIGSGFTAGIAFYFSRNQSINFQYNLQKLQQSFQFKEGKNKHNNQQFGINYQYTF